MKVEHCLPGQAHHHLNLPMRSVVFSRTRSLRKEAGARWSTCFEQHWLGQFEHEVGKRFRWLIWHWRVHAFAFKSVMNENTILAKNFVLRSTFSIFCFIDNCTVIVSTTSITRMVQQKYEIVERQFTVKRWLNFSLHKLTEIMSIEHCFKMAYIHVNTLLKQ